MRVCLFIDSVDYEQVNVSFTVGTEDELQFDFIVFENDQVEENETLQLHIEAEDPAIAITQPSSMEIIIINTDSESLCSL